jgi:hypothetical protein
MPKQSEKSKLRAALKRTLSSVDLLLPLVQPTIVDATFAEKIDTARVLLAECQAMLALPGIGATARMKPAAAPARELQAGDPVQLREPLAKDYAQLTVEQRAGWMLAEVRGTMAVLTIPGCSEPGHLPLSHLVLAPAPVVQL